MAFKNNTNITLDGLLLFRDSSSCYAESLALALVHPTQSLTVVTIPGRDNLLKRRYPSICERTSFMFLSSGSFLEEILSKIMSSSPCACFVDCIDIVIDIVGVEKTVAFLFQLKKKLPVLAICPSPSVSEETLKRFESVADSITTVQAREGQCTADTASYRRSGKCKNLTETFFVSEDLRISSARYIPSAHYSENLRKNVKIEGSLEMELELRDKEQIAKKQLPLPFTSATKQSGSARLSPIVVKNGMESSVSTTVSSALRRTPVLVSKINEVASPAYSDLASLRMADRKVRVGGQIIYTPDKGDDLDDSDPDDDLNL